VGGKATESEALGWVDGPLQRVEDWFIEKSLSGRRKPDMEELLRMRRRRERVPGGGNSYSKADTWDSQQTRIWWTKSTRRNVMFQYRVKIGRVSSRDCFVSDAGNLKLNVVIGVCVVSCSCYADGFQCYRNGWWESPRQSSAHWPPEEEERVGWCYGWCSKEAAEAQPQRWKPKEESATKNTNCLLWHQGINFVRQHSWTCCYGQMCKTEMCLYITTNNINVIILLISIATSIAK